MAVCKICASDRRQEIEAALLGGGSIRAVAASFGLNRGQVHRHSQHAEQRNPSAKNLESSGGSQRLRKLYSKIEALFEKASSKGDHRAAAQLAGQLEAIDLRIFDSPRARSEERPVFRIVLDSPVDGDNRRVAPGEYIDLAIGFLGWRVVLEQVLSKMVDAANESSAVRTAAMTFLKAMIEIESQEEETNGQLGAPST